MKDITSKALGIDWVHETINKGKVFRTNRQVVYVSKVARIYERLGGNIILKIEVIHNGKLIENGYFDLNGAKNITKKYSDNLLEITINSAQRILRIKIIKIPDRKC